MCRRSICEAKRCSVAGLLSKNVQAKDPDHPGGDWDFFLITNWN